MNDAAFTVNTDSGYTATVKTDMWHCDLGGGAKAWCYAPGKETNVATCTVTDPAEAELARANNWTMLCLYGVGLMT